MKLVYEVMVGDQKLFIYANLQYQAGRLITWTDSNHVMLRADDTTDGVLPDLHGWTKTISADGIATYSYQPPELFVGITLSLVTSVLLIRSWFPVLLKKRAHHVN